MTSQGDTVLIEATEPVAYSVSRPDALSLVVDMRNVSVSDARADVDRQGAIAGVRLEQASAADGRALARVHVTLAKPSEYVVRSARNTIRVEVKGAVAAPALRGCRRSQRRASSATSRRPRVPCWSPPALAEPQPQPPVKPAAWRPRRASNRIASPARSRRRSSSASSRARRRARRPSRSSATATSRRSASPRARTVRAGWSSTFRT